MEPEAAVMESVASALGEGATITVEVDASVPTTLLATPLQDALGATATAEVTLHVDEGAVVEIDVQVSTARLASLYSRFKASTFRFDFGDEDNLATLAAIPLVQSHMQSKSTFTEHELFSIIFRFNRPYPSAAEEALSAISRRFVDAEMLEIATGLVLRCVLRTRYRDARVMLSHVCGGPHNAPDLRFFLAHEHIFIVLPRQPHAAATIDFTMAQAKEEEEDDRSSTSHPGSLDADEEDSDSDETVDDDDDDADGANPWVLLRANVKHAITDKASVVAALRVILGEARDQRLTLLVLRQRFERDCGVPFGCAGCGSLTSFLKKQRAIFHVAEARKKKNLKSTLEAGHRVGEVEAQDERGDGAPQEPRQRLDENQDTAGGSP